MNAPYTIDDWNSDVHNLYHLLDAIVSGITEIDRRSPEPDALAKVEALCCIARDQTERIGKAVEANFYAQRGHSETFEEAAARLLSGMVARKGAAS